MAEHQGRNQQLKIDYWAGLQGDGYVARKSTPHLGDQVASIKHYQETGCTINYFRLFCKVKAIGHIIGSVLSHSNASTVLAKNPTQGVQVAQIQYFA